MAFSDPIEVKVDGTNTVKLARVSTGDLQSRYLSEDDTIKATISTQETGTRKRHLYRLDLSKFTADPYNTSQNLRVTASAYLVIDRPVTGFTNAELLKLVEGLSTEISESTYSTAKKLIASES